MKSFDMNEKLRYFASTHGTRYMFGILVLIMIMAAAFHLQRKASYEIDFQEQQLVISGPAGTEPLSADYQSIHSVTLLDDYTIGKAVSGAGQSRLNYGKYRNDIYGEYSLCVVPSIPIAIEIRTDSDIIVFNYESKEVTAALSQALTDLIAQKQQ